MSDPQAEIVKAVITVKAFSMQNAPSGTYLALTLPEEQGGEASCWDEKYWDHLMRNTNVPINVTMRRNGHNRRTGAPYQNITAIEGVGEPAKEEPAKETPPQQTRSVASPQGMGPLILTPGPKALKVELSSDTPELRARNLVAITTLVQCGAVKAEFFHAVIASGEEYILNGTRFMLVEGKPEPVAKPQT